MKLSQATFTELAQLVHGLCGLVLGPDKAYLIHHRLEPLVRQQGLPSFEALCGVLRQPNAVILRDALVEAITTGETSFFRDRHVFDSFRQYVLPEVVERWRAAGGAQGKIRIWVAGVSTGQEAYSLAMVLHEYLTRLLPGMLRPDVSILASDISVSSLDVARQAEYSIGDLRRGLTADDIQRHFEPSGPHWRVKSPIRRLIEFRRINLIQRLLGLGSFDIIFCRNVLIYFDEPARRAICQQFEAMVPDGGWLVLGTAENLYGISDAFVSVRQGPSLFYRKTPARNSTTARS